MPVVLLQNPPEKMRFWPKHKAYLRSSTTINDTVDSLDVCEVGRQERQQLLHLVVFGYHFIEYIRSVETCDELLGLRQLQVVYNILSRGLVSCSCQSHSRDTRIHPWNER